VQHKFHLQKSIVSIKLCSSNHQRPKSQLYFKNFQLKFNHKLKGE
jgi:hypothetical protein